MLEPFLVTDGQLGLHWNALAKELGRVLDASQGVFELKPEAVDLSTIAHIAGRAVRRANRLMGEPVPVAPLAVLQRGWEAWLGYREVWSKSEARKLAFASADLTIFLTPVGAESFQQVLRAEWSGPANVGGDCVFRPSNAGHPHWQIDLGELIREDQELAAARDLLRQTGVRDFGEFDANPTADPPWYRLGRMHFASAMRPWSDASIAHPPTDLSAVRNWVINTSSLLKEELARL